MKQAVYTVGYTLFDARNKTGLTDLFNCLRLHRVDYLADVRAKPFSGQFPLFNAPQLKEAGRLFKIPYVPMPELGALPGKARDIFSPACEILEEDVFPIAKSNRPDKRVLQGQNEIADFSKIRDSAGFLEGLNRIKTACLKGYTLCLMCCEKDPLCCHRSYLIGAALEEKFGDLMEVRHMISEPGGKIALAGQGALNQRLIETVLSKSAVKKLKLQALNADGSSKLDP